MHSHNKLFRIIVAAVLLVVAVLIVHNIELPVWQQLLIFLVPYLVAGYDVLGEALEGIMEREPFNEDLLMSIATLGALSIGFLPGAATEFPEAVFVMLFFQVGELFENYAEDRSRKSIAELMDIRPDVAHVERFSTHPIAVSLREAYSHEQDGCTVEQVEEVSGQGVRAVVNGKKVCVGNTKMMEQLQVRFHPCELVGTIVHVAVEGEYFGHIVISDEMKSDAREAVASLKAAGVRRTVMLTGDRREVGEDVAKQLGLDEVHTELLPAEKVERVEALLEAKADGQSLIFVGDGMNDAPVLARADVGMAMGGLGSDAAIEAADVVIMDDKPSKVALAIALARRTVGIAMQNAWFAIGVKVLVLFLAAFGIATMWMAVFADVGVMVLAVLNAMRALKS